MVKNKDIANSIEKLIRDCDSFELTDVRNHLQRALREIQEKESRKNKKEEKVSFQQKWQFDLGSSSLVYGSLNKNQKQNVLNKIEGMIESEKNKIKTTSQKKDIIID